MQPGRSMVVVGAGNTRINRCGYRYATHRGSGSVIDWRPLAQQLADQLADVGYLNDPQWRRAFADTPRHVFVPHYYADDGTLVDGYDPAAKDGWLDAVYSDDSLITQQAQVPDTELR